MEHVTFNSIYNGLVSTAPHGGDVYSHDVDLDFSVNTNPCADTLLRAVFSGNYEELEDTPFLSRYVDAFSQVKDAAMRGLQLAAQYPDLRCEVLKREISHMEHVEPERIVCGNGASELFMAIVRAVRPARALIVAPCYSGYEYALNAEGCDILRYELKEDNGFTVQEDLPEMLTDAIDIFFLAQPNNPTGRLVESQLMDRIVQSCEEKNIILVTDACFYPLAADGLLAAEGNHVIVKAFTKTMAIPGLRLGYLTSGSRELKEKIECQLSEWSVSSVAQEAGCAAARVCAQTDFLEASRQYIAREREYLKNRIEAAGLTVYDSDTCYLLVKGRPGMWNLLLDEKILVRNCENFSGLGPEYIRIAVKMHKDNIVLAEQIASLLR